jgi:tetratricopeptide (TPR) repeat protein
MRPTLNLNCDLDLDWLIALEFGRVDDGRPDEAVRPICDSFGYFLDEPEGKDVGFRALEFSKLDLSEATLAPIWDGTRFDVPVLALSDATAGEILLAARAFYERGGSFNRDLFSAATKAEGWQAIDLWRRCLQCGDDMAHFGLGYTFLELDRHHQAYRHLRYYTEIAPAGSWNWCWYGKAALAIGEVGEAKEAFLRAIDLTADGDHETEAPELLLELETDRPAER